MLQKTTKLLIGKDISRDAQCADGATIAVWSASGSIADGEILVLDKNKNILVAGATVLDSDIIYLCQGTGETFSYTEEDGTAITASRKVIFSDPIEGAKVRKFTGNGYTAKAEQTATIDFTGLTPVVGTEYIIRVIYKDMPEHPGQFTQTYRYISTTAVLATWLTAMVAKVNAHAGRRVQASENASSLVLTAKEKPECCTALTDIDEFSMVDFEVVANYVTTAGNWATIPSTATTVTYTGAIHGSGNWEQIRDIEKGQWGYVGVTNRTHFPVLSPTMSTTVDKTYNMYIIEHDRSYLSPDNQYRKDAPLQTILAFEVFASGDQQANVLDRLNPWMESVGIDSVVL